MTAATPEPTLREALDELARNLDALGRLMLHPYGEREYERIGGLIGYVVNALPVVRRASAALAAPEHGWPDADDAAKVLATVMPYVTEYGLEYVVDALDEASRE